MTSGLALPFSWRAFWPKLSLPPSSPRQPGPRKPLEGRSWIGVSFWQPLKTIIREDFLEIIRTTDAITGLDTPLRSMMNVKLSKRDVHDIPTITYIT